MVVLQWKVFDKIPFPPFLLDAFVDRKMTFQTLRASGAENFLICLLFACWSTLLSRQ